MFAFSLVRCVANLLTSMCSTLIWAHVSAAVAAAVSFLDKEITGDSMRSIRKFAYAAALGLSLFAIQPTLATAEEAHGSFTLSHEVRCQNIVLRPGDYTFSVDTKGSFDFVTLRGLNGGTSAMLMVDTIETSKPDQASRLVLVSRGGQSFITTMDLPNYDISLGFAVSRASTPK
jgi:hypothetical protein